MFLPYQHRHSFTTRLLYSLMPSNWYARKDASVNALLQSLADDLTNLFHNGVTVCVAFDELMFPFSWLSFFAAYWPLIVSFWTGSVECQWACSWKIRLAAKHAPSMLYTWHARGIGRGFARPTALSLALLAAGSATCAQVMILVGVKVGDSWGDYF